MLVVGVALAHTHSQGFTSQNSGTINCTIRTLFRLANDRTMLRQYQSLRVSDVS